METLNAALVIAALIIGAVVFWLVLQVRRSTAASEKRRKTTRTRSGRLKDNDTSDQRPAL